MEYKVTWKINLEADSAEEAAELARSIQADPESTATVFEVLGPDGLDVIDLLEEHTKVLARERAERVRAYYRKRMAYCRERMAYYLLTDRDVGKRSIRAWGKVWPVADFLGCVLPGDIGKRVYLVGDVLQVENGKQRAERERASG